MGLLGLAGLAFQLVQHPPGPGLPPELGSLSPAFLVALSLANPLLLLILSALVGAALAHRAGLASRVAGTGHLAARPPAWALAVTLGLALALALHLIDRAWLPWLGAADDALRAHDAGSATPLILGVLYGGLAEEVMLRWGVLSLFAWGLHRWFGRGGPRPATWVLVLATLASALLFAAAHLPALAAVTTPTAALVARTLVLNTLAGVVYGTLFCRRGLESAMAAHAATHLGFWLLARLS